MRLSWPASSGRACGGRKRSPSSSPTTIPEDGALAVRNGKGRKSPGGVRRERGEEALAAWIDVRGDPAGRSSRPSARTGMPAGADHPGRGLPHPGARPREAHVKPFSPHDARRSYVTALLAAGSSITVVQSPRRTRFGGTTARYDRSGEDAKRRAAETLHVPFAG